jgi:uncharacterized coiled-coil protein SlyX
MDTESTNEHLARLERVMVLQQKMIDRLSVAVTGHQKILEAWSQAAGIEPEPAPPAPPIN